MSTTRVYCRHDLIGVFVSVGSSDERVTRRRGNIRVQILLVFAFVVVLGSFLGACCAHEHWLSAFKQRCVKQRLMLALWFHKMPRSTLCT